MDIGFFIIDQCIQLKIENGALAVDSGLETSVLISLFTDARVSDDELPDGLTDKRGWWGDLFSNIEGDKIGSKLWTLSRAKIELTTLAGIENFVVEALNWMIEDGVATSIDVNASYDEFNRAIVAININRPQGDEPNRFDFFWNQQDLLRA